MTPSGIVTEVRFGRSKKAYFPIDVIPLSMTTVVISWLRGYHGALLAS